MRGLTGDEDFDAAFPGLYRAAFNAALRITGDREEAEDAAIEAAYRVAVRWHRVRDHHVPWTVRVASNLALDSAKRGRRRGASERSVGPRSTEPSQEDARVDLVEALRDLPTRQREVVVLRYLADISERDTAALLGLAPGSVKSHASRGLAALKDRLATSHVPSPSEGRP